MSGKHLMLSIFCIQSAVDEVLDAMYCAAEWGRCLRPAYDPFLKDMQMEVVANVMHQPPSGMSSGIDAQARQRFHKISIC
ncbi:hypothetical protein WN944_012728 [Citrus x changshan-huyou]|uniref:Uncharacterized protein n=1 Tax=Citrus x changshan-huyou TaxID=2935761 RepID=A0AAP0M7A4_9ROSI